MASFKNLFHHFKNEQEQEIDFTNGITPDLDQTLIQPKRVVAQRREPNVYPQFGKRFTFGFLTYYLKHQRDLDPADRSILNVISIHKITVGRYLWWLENTHLLCPMQIHREGMADAGVYYRACLHRLNELIEKYREEVFSEF